MDRDDLRELSVLRPWRTTLAIALDWGTILVAIAVSVWADNWPVYLAAVAVIAGRQHALAVLIHDFAHYRFLKDKRLSEWIGDLFLAWPILITVNSYRTTHLQHHFHTNTEKDPDYVPRLKMRSYKFPMSLTFLVSYMSSYLVMIGTLMDVMGLHLKKMQNAQTRYYVWIRLGFYASIGVIVGLTGVWKEFVLYWAVPFLTLFFAFNYVRGVAEHFSGMDYSSLEGGTRTVIPHFWERAFFCPHHVNYHTEHHINPGVPFYNLPQLFEKMMEDPEYRSVAHITKGYSTGLVKEVLSDSYVRPAELSLES